VEKTLTVKESPERVLQWTEEKLVKEFPHRSQVTRPLTAPNTVQVFVEHSIFPESGLSWVFNLTLTVLTLGSWLLIYAVWAVLKVGETKKWTKVSAYPRDEEGFSRIHLEGNREDWFSVVSGWLTEKYSPQEA
jgi:hypothetical protein